jgi:putative Holliday junction resolvase
MAIVPIDDLKHLHDKKHRLLGLDLGDKTIGLALTDTLWVVATALEIHKRIKFKQDANYIINLTEKYNVAGLVMGWPLNMNGTEGPRCQSTRQFCNNLLSMYDIPIILWDERWSTKAAEAAMLENDLSRKKRKKNIDKTAAAVILQNALDYLSL